jgi:hypothetical protein
MQHEHAYAKLLKQLSNNVVTKPSSKSLGVSFVSLLEEVSRYTESASVGESCK